MTELSYVAQKTIECFKDAGLDQNYLADKENEFSELSNYAALHQALHTGRQEHAPLSSKVRRSH